MDIAEPKLAKLSECRKDVGTHHIGMLKTARALGFKAKAKKLSNFEDLDKLVNLRGIPVVVGWFSEWTDHYSVVIGLDKEFVYLDNPERDKPVHKIERWLFNHLWFDFIGKNDERVCWRWMMWVEKKSEVGSRKSDG